MISTRLADSVHNAVNSSAPPGTLHTVFARKPVDYGSESSNLAFVVALSTHACCGLAAFTAVPFVLLATKGSLLHRSAGWVFVGGMALCAVIGMVLDIVRMTVNPQANATTYNSFSPPSDAGAHIGFFHAGSCVLHMLVEGIVGRRIVQQLPAASSAVVYGHVSLAWTALNSLALVAIVPILLLLYDVWTGAVWMVVTFSLLEIRSGWYWWRNLRETGSLLCLPAAATAASPSRSAIPSPVGPSSDVASTTPLLSVPGGKNISRRNAISPLSAAALRVRYMLSHEYNMLVLTGFNWWGAAQGFGPAILLAIQGVPPHPSPSAGLSRGPVDIASLFLFLAFWSLFFGAAGAIGFFFRRRRLRKARSAALQEESSSVQDGVE